MKIVIEIIKFLITAFVITNIVDIFLMGFLPWRFSRRAKVSSFFVKPTSKTVKTPSQSYFEFQETGACAGFSSAFLLRHLGQAATGNEAIKEVPFTYANGAAFPKGITGFFKKKGMKVKPYSGNFAALKNEICRGNPVIVVIRSFPRKSYLHFACITGYDEENFYLADSIRSWVNVDKVGNPIQPSEETASTCDEEVYYNRVVPIKIYKQLWNTSMLKMPLYRNIFFVMK